MAVKNVPVHDYTIPVHGGAHVGMSASRFCNSPTGVLQNVCATGLEGCQARERPHRTAALEHLEALRGRGGVDNYTL